MGSQSVRGIEADGPKRGGNGGKSGVERRQLGGIEPQVLDALGPHPLSHGPTDHVSWGQLVDEPFAAGVAQQGAVAPQRLRQQRAGHGRVMEGGRVELHELDVGHRHAGPEGHGHAVGGGFDRVGGDGEQLPGAPGGQNGVGGPHLDHPAFGVEGPHPAAASVFDQQVEGEPLLHHGGGRGPGGVDQGPLDLGTGGRPAGVDDPGGGVTALAGQGQGSSRLAVEHGAHGDELAHPGGALVHQDPDGVGIAQSGAGGQGVGQMEVGRVLVPAEHGGHTSLGPTGGRLGQLRLGQHAHPDVPGRTSPSPVGAQGGGQPHGGRQPGHTTAQNENVESGGVPAS